MSPLLLSRPISLFLTVALILTSSWSEAFYVATELCRRYSCCRPNGCSNTVGLNMAKGTNKQAELKRKLELARLQKMEENSSQESASRLSAEQLKERNDRLRFDELLKQGGASVLNDYSSDGYLNRKQEEEEITAAQLGVDRLFEGDPAPADCFEELVSVKTENAIGIKGKERLVPWLRKNADRKQDYLLVITDPRPKSFELQQSVTNILAELPPEIQSRMIIINADSPADNRKWLKKGGLDGKIELYSDEKLAWMRAYTALGEKRWSMTMFIIADGRVQKLARDLDQYGATRAIRNAVKSLNEARL